MKFTALLFVLAFSTFGLGCKKTKSSPSGGPCEQLRSVCEEDCEGTMRDDCLGYVTPSDVPRCEDGLESYSMMCGGGEDGGGGYGDGGYGYDDAGY